MHSEVADVTGIVQFIDKSVLRHQNVGGGWGGDKAPTGPLLRRLCVAKNVKKKNVTEEFCSGFGMQLWHHYHVPFLCPRFTPQFLHFCDIFVSSKFEQVHFSFLSREVG